jgi:rRNA maturation protein Rpf1
MVYSRAERVFILEHYFASKSFPAVREAFSSAYPDKDVPNMTTIHRLVTKFRRQEVFAVTSAHRVTKQMKLRPYRFQAVHQLQK